MKKLKVTNVVKSFNGQRVVDDISFEAEQGEILGFLGPNGAGKTTTIRMIMSITAPDEGEIRAVAADGSSKPLEQSLIGYLPEERGLYKEAKVMKILQFLAGLKNVEKNEAKERALLWLAKFGLENYTNTKIEELSKGMAQKVQFIGSILHQPKLIILDEPFSGLDPVSQDVIKSELRRLADGGATILLSSHQMNIMEELCDRIFLIHKGKEVFYGSLPEVKERYGNYRVKLSTNDDRSSEQLFSSSLIESYQQINGNRFQIQLKDGVEPAAFLSEIDRNLPLTELSLSRSSLHDIFVKIALGGSNE